MRRTLYNELAFHGVVSAGTATVEIVLPEIGKLHAVELIYKSDLAAVVARRTKAQMLLEIDYIELICNTKVFRKIPIAEVFEDYERIGETVKDGVIPLLFSDKSMSNEAGQDAFAFILASKEQGFGDKLKVKVKLLASTDPELEARNIWETIGDGNFEHMLKTRGTHHGQPLLEVDSKGNVKRARGGTRQMVLNSRNDTVSPGKTGKHRIALTGEGRNPLWLHMRSTDFDYLEIFRGSEKLWDGEDVDFTNDLVGSDYVAITGLLSFSPMMLSGGRFNDQYVFKGKNLYLDLNMTAATAFDIRVDEYGDVAR